MLWYILPYNVSTIVLIVFDNSRCVFIEKRCFEFRALNVQFWMLSPVHASILVIVSIHAIDIVVFKHTELKFPFGFPPYILEIWQQNFCISQLHFLNERMYLCKIFSQFRFVYQFTVQALIAMCFHQVPFAWKGLYSRNMLMKFDTVWNM